MSRPGRKSLDGLVEVVAARSSLALLRRRGLRFLNNAATSAHNCVNAFCSSAGSLARAAASRMPARSVSFCQ